MPTFVRSLARVLLPLACAASAARSQPPIRALTLGAVEREFDSPRTMISGLHELANGDVVLVDARERTVLLLEARTGAARPISREGSGPLEYRRPTLLLPAPGDSILLFDAELNRFLVLDGGGAPRGTRAAVRLEGGPGSSYVVDVRGVDSAGRLYFALPVGLITDRDRGVPILRRAAVAARIDTIAVAPAIPAPVRREGAAAPSGPGVGFGGTRPLPYAVRNEWLSTPDGAVAIINAAPYRVDWIDTQGRITRGTPVNVAPIPIGEREKEAWRNEARARGGPVVRSTTADGRTTETVLPITEPSEWPAHLPPFRAGSARLSADGRLWIARSAPGSAAWVTYDVFDRAGRLAQQLRLPVASRIVGFGDGTLYLATADDDDLMHLTRHALPK